MSETNKQKTEAKELARQARLFLEAARALKTLKDECTADELNGYRYRVGEAINELIESAVTCPGIRIAVFADAEVKKEEQ